MKKGRLKTYINVVEDMYEGLCTSVKSMYKETDDFNVRVGMHQWSALSSGFCRNGWSCKRDTIISLSTNCKKIQKVFTKKYCIYR